MDFLFKTILSFALIVRDEIFSAIKKQYPTLKNYQIWALYDAWDEKYSKHEYLKISGRNGKFLPRLENSETLRFWAEFENFSQMGVFLDSVTADKNAIIKLNNGESWKLVSVDSSLGEFFNGTDKLPAVLITYEQIC